MKQSIPSILLFSAVLAAGCGCASKRQTGKIITATPSPYVLTPDSANRVQMDLVFHIPASYFSNRERLVITPQLVVEDTVRDNYPPVVLASSVYTKKLNRKRELNRYQDPYEAETRQIDDVNRSFVFPYKQTLQLPSLFTNGRIVATVSVDGCGSCAEIDTIDLAVICRPVKNRLAGRLRLSPVQPRAFTNRERPGGKKERIRKRAVIHADFSPFRDQEKSRATKSERIR